MEGGKDGEKDKGRWTGKRGREQRGKEGRSGRVEGEEWEGIGKERRQAEGGREIIAEKSNPPHGDCQLTHCLGEN